MFKRFVDWLGRWCVRTQCGFAAVSALLLVIGSPGCANYASTQAAKMQTGPKAEVGHPSSIAMAAAEGDTKRVQELLAQGASLSDQTFANCMTLLNTAAATGHTDLVEFLLTRGLNPNIPSSTGETALAMAVLCESADTVRILLEAGANPNAPNIEGWTPLHAAALSDNMEVMDMLLKHGGDPTIRNLAGQTPGAVARAEGHLKVANRLDSAASAWNR